MKKYAAFAQDTLELLQGDLLGFLERNGPATKLQIMAGLRWHETRTALVMSSQPKWLVAVGTTRSEKKFGRLVLYHCHGEHILGVCSKCGRKNFHPALKDKEICHACVAHQPKPKEQPRLIPGVDVSQPTSATPGSPVKARILGARLDLGLPMHLPGDEYMTNPGWSESQEEPDEDE